jgi:hypothetical protein
MPNGDSGGVVTVKNWTVVLAFATWLVSGGALYATMKAQADDNARRIQELEQRPTVTLPQYQEGQEYLKQRLDRLERKIDDIDGTPPRRR